MKRGLLDWLNNNQGKALVIFLVLILLYFSLTRGQRLLFGVIVLFFSLS